MILCVKIYTFRSQPGFFFCGHVFPVCISTTGRRYISCMARWRCSIWVVLLLAGLSYVLAYERNVAVNGDVSMDDDNHPFRGISPESFDVGVQRVPIPVPADDPMPWDPFLAIEWHQRKVRASVEKIAPTLSDVVRAKLWMHNQGTLAFSVKPHDAHFQELRVR
jgi:hypothetical protein